MWISVILPLLVTGGGLYFIIKLRAFYILHPYRTLRSMKGKVSLSDVISFILALSGTLGVGNILGVAVGISVGGAGSVFWLLLSCIFSSAIKYAEVTLSRGTASKDKKGITSLIDSSFGRSGSALCLIYTASALLLSLTMGCALQSGAIASSALSFRGGSRPLTLLLPLLTIVAAIVLGGGEKIKKAVGYIIPATTIIYIIMCFSVIIPNIRALPDIFLEIITSAFGIDGLKGGIMGGAVIISMREGYSRGILSNEAGAGTSSFAHTSTESGDPCVGGIFGMLEVVFDTVILCMLTAFAILCGTEVGGFRGELGELSAIFSRYLGPIAPGLLFICTTAFALSTILCWYYYGRISLRQLIDSMAPRSPGKPFNILFFILFDASVCAGLFIDERIFIAISDVLLLIMTLITLPSLIKNCDRLKRLSQRSGFI